MYIAELSRLRAATRVRPDATVLEEGRNIYIFGQPIRLCKWGEWGAYGCTGSRTGWKRLKSRPRAEW